MPCSRDILMVRDDVVLSKYIVIVQKQMWIRKETYNSSSETTPLLNLWKVHTDSKKKIYIRIIDSDEPASLQFSPVNLRPASSSLFYELHNM